MVVELNKNIERHALFYHYKSKGYEINESELFNAKNKRFYINNTFKTISKDSFVSHMIHYSFYDLNIPLVRFYNIGGELYLKTGIHLVHLKTGVFNTTSQDLNSSLIKKPIIIKGGKDIQLFHSKNKKYIFIEMYSNTILISSKGHGLSEKYTTYIDTLLKSGELKRVDNIIFNKHLNLNNKVNHDF